MIHYKNKLLFAQTNFILIANESVFNIHDFQESRLTPRLRWNLPNFTSFWQVTVEFGPKLEFDWMQAQLCHWLQKIFKKISPSFLEVGKHDLQF